MDVVPAGLRSEATSRYIADVVNHPVAVRVRYAFPNRWGAHVAYAGRDYRAPTHDLAERWDVVPGFASDGMRDAQLASSLARLALSTEQLERALLEIRGFRPLVPEIRPYAEDLWTWSHPGACTCPPGEREWFLAQLGALPEK